MKRLFGLKTKEVSLVDKGANKKKFIITKSDQGAPMTKEEITKLMEKMDDKSIAKLEEVVKSLKLEEGEDSIGKMSPKAEAAMKAIGRIMSPFKGDMKKSHMEKLMKEMGMCDDDEEKENLSKEEIAMGYMGTPSKMLSEHGIEALNKAKDAFKEHLEKLGYPKYPEQQITQKKAGDDEEEEDEEDEVSKVNKAQEPLSAFTPEQKTQLESVFKANKDLSTENEKLKGELKVERDARITKELVIKAEGFKNLGKPEDIAAILKSVSEKDPETAKKLEEILASGHKALETSEVFKEYGSRMSGSTGTPDATLDALVNSKLNEIKKSDKHATFAETYDQVLQTEEGRKLYAQIKSSRKGGA